MDSLSVLTETIRHDSVSTALVEDIFRQLGSPGAAPVWMVGRFERGVFCAQLVQHSDFGLVLPVWTHMPEPGPKGDTLITVAGVGGPVAFDAVGQACGALWAQAVFTAFSLGVMVSLNGVLVGNPRKDRHGIDRVNANFLAISNRVARSTMEG